MREIKFRVWVPSQNSMGEPFNPFDNADGGLFPKDSIFMQFTGLLDKNGKEIYEGDIVKARYAPKYELVTFEVKWHIDSASFVCYRIHENPQVKFEQLPLCPSNSMADLDVIGNIYENPELLK